MKKLTLTFCALFAFGSALYAGTEKYSGKEKEVMQPAPPVCELYRAHEWDLDIWGAYAFSANPGRFDVPNDDPFHSDFFSTNGPEADPGTYLGSSTIAQPEEQNPNERVNLGRETKDELIGRDDTFGGGFDLKYFWSRYFGAGIEGLGLAAKTNFAGAELATLTMRYPFGRFAPYGWGGIGAVEGGGALYHFFNEKHIYADGFVVQPNGDPGGDREFWTDDFVQNKKARAIGQLGAGLEFRVTCHIGLMADFSWNFVFGKEGSVDKIQPVVEQGTIIFINDPNTVTQVINTAGNLKPGSGSDNQDFGMARFGVTFSY